MRINRFLAKNWLTPPFIFVLLLFGRPMAQSQPNVHDAAILPDSAKGYWRLYTDYKSGLTRVSFYTPKHELLYEEHMKDRYIKLTKRTIAQFNDVLTRLVEGHLLADRVKSYNLRVSINGTVPGRFSSPRADEPPIASDQMASDQLWVNVLPIQGKKLRLWYKNPTQQPLLISIKDEVSQNMYRAVSLTRTNSELFNLSHLPTGRYRLSIASRLNTVEYNLVIAEEDELIEFTGGASLSTRLAQGEVPLPYE